MLLVGRLEPLVAASGRHGRIGVGGADLLVLARLLRITLGFRNRLVLGADLLDPAAGERLPAHVRTDQ